MWGSPAALDQDYFFSRLGYCSDWDFWPLPGHWLPRLSARLLLENGLLAHSIRHLCHPEGSQTDMHLHLRWGVGYVGIHVNH